MTRSVVLLCALFLLSGCSPRLTPLYRDYEVVMEAAAEQESEDRADVTGRIRSALQAAGWQLQAPVTPNVVATAPRSFRQWGLYAVTVELEVAPLYGNHVRLFVHPYRTYITGAKRKIPYLRGSLARSVLKDLHAALEAEGLDHIGTAQSRDRAILEKD